MFIDEESKGFERGRARPFGNEMYVFGTRDLSCTGAFKRRAPEEPCAMDMTPCDLYLYPIPRFNTMSAYQTPVVEDV